jgi:nucleotide-binding universal stress UspA family protein
MSESTMSLQGGDVVAALDGSAHDDTVVGWAAAEAARTGSTLRLVSVVDAGMQLTPYDILSTGSPGIADEVARETHEHLDDAAGVARAAHPELSVVADTPWGSPATGLVQASEGTRLLAMGSPAHAGFGSVVVPVMAHAHCPVVVVPDGSRTGRPRVAVVGVDGSDHSRHALAYALSAVDPDGGEVICVAAWRTEIEAEMLITYAMSDSVPEIDARYAALLDGVIRDLAPWAPGVTVTPLVEHGHTAPVLLEVAADKDADLIVVGSRGHGGFAGLLLGSVSRRVVAKSDRPVAVVR